MKLILPFIAVVCACSVALADTAPTTQPADPTASVTLGQLELKANEDMAKNEYRAALPLLEIISQRLLDQPDQLGPVEEQIRVCKKQLSGQATPPPPQQSVVALMDGGVRKPHPLVPAGQTLELPIKELGNFDYDAENGGNIPDDVMKLEGIHFRTSGYMIPLDQAESISEFALVPSLFACCFGQPPQIQHTIVVTCPKGKAVSYFPDELTVEGTLHVHEQKDGGFIVSIFQIDASSVRPAAK
jgi:hypothetical protein